MTDERLSLSGESAGEFGRSLLLVLCAHVLLGCLVWAGGKFFFKRPAPEPITWLDGGGELGSAAALASPEDGDAIPPAPEILPPLPADPAPTPKELSETTFAAKTPTPAPKPAATPAPKPKFAVRRTPTPGKKATPSKKIAKVATPRPGAKVVAPKITDSTAKPEGAGTGLGNAPSGAGKDPNAGAKGGPGAAGGTNAVLAGYFKKVEAQFRREWQKPLTVVRTGREVEADVKLRAAADGTVESLALVKPTGNHEVDQSIEQALRRVTKVERPPRELLKNGVLDEMVAFILEL